MPKELSSIRERQSVGLREPPRYQVIIYNDDFTTMEFVVMILRTIFLKSAEEAESLMMVSRVKKAMRLARQEGFPLRLEYKEE